MSGKAKIMKHICFKGFPHTMLQMQSWEEYQNVQSCKMPKWQNAETNSGGIAKTSIGTHADKMRNTANYIISRITMYWIHWSCLFVRSAPSHLHIFIFLSSYLVFVLKAVPAKTFYIGCYRGDQVSDVSLFWSQVIPAQTFFTGYGKKSFPLALTLRRSVLMTCRVRELFVHVLSGRQTMVA